MLTVALPTLTQTFTSSMLDAITPVILTYNEAPNIERTLQKLTWARRILIVDSFSTDETLEIARRYPQVEILQRAFDSFGGQWNYSLAQVTTPWVLSLDADYCLSDQLIAELATLDPEAPVDRYFIPFQYCVFGKPLRGTLLPPRDALFRRDQVTFGDDGHRQILVCQGTAAILSAPMRHDDRKSLQRWLWAQDRYALLEVKKLRERPMGELGLSDRIRRIPGLSALILLVYCLILKGGILDGYAGWYYAFQRVIAELVLSLRLIEDRQGLK